MKRPQSGPARRTASGLPSAPVKVQTKETPKTPAKAKAPAKARLAKAKVSTAKSAKAVSVKKIAFRKPSVAKKTVQREVKRFTAQTRKRRAIAWTVIASFGSLLLLTLSAMFTPLLAVEKIEVSGISRLKEKSIVNALVSQIGKPLPMVNPADISTALKAFPLIESFSVISLPPHTLRIQIEERQPIGIIVVSGTSYLYDPAGVRIGIAKGSENLPMITIEGSPEKSKQFAAAIDVLMALPADLLQRVSEINAKSKDDVTLRLRGYAGQRIIWGDGSDSVLKSKVLDALIANQKKTDRVTYDVSSPNAPVVRYGNF